MIKLYKLWVVFFVILLAGCGTQDGGTGGTPPVAGVTVQSVTLASSLAGGTLLAQGGTTTITATVTGSDGNPITDGTEVVFTASGGTITGSVPTVSGKATATYNAASAGASVNITATAGGVTSNPMTISVASGAASVIIIKSVSPDRLALKGSGTNEVGTIIFTVKDAGGNTVSDGQVVTFNLDTTAGSGATLSAASAATVGGDVSVAVSSGTSPGVATVSASTTSASGTAATEARITMGYGMPDQLHIGLAFEKLNVAGNVKFDIPNTLTAYVADRYSNPVPAGTPVSFAGECGIVGLTSGTAGTTNLTDSLGRASVTAITAAPTSPLCNYIIWTEGEEAYVDANGNGYYDAGESHTDVGEPFIDANHNGQYDPATELYFDTDSSGTYTAPDGVWQSDTYVWTSGNVVWSGYTAEPQIVPTSFNIAPGGSQAFTYIVADDNGNPLPAGTTVSVTTDCPTSS